MECSIYEKLKVADIILKPFKGFTETELYYMVVKHPNKKMVNIMLDGITHDDFLFKYGDNLIYTMKENCG